MFPWLFVSLQMPLPSFCGQRKLWLESKVGLLEAALVCACLVTDAAHFLMLVLSLAEPHTSRCTTILCHSCRALETLCMNEMARSGWHILHISPLLSHLFCFLIWLHFQNTNSNIKSSIISRGDSRELNQMWGLMNVTPVRRTHESCP